MNIDTLLRSIMAVATDMYLLSVLKSIYLHVILILIIIYISMIT